MYMSTIYLFYYKIIKVCASHHIKYIYIERTNSLYMSVIYIVFASPWHNYKIKYLDVDNSSIFKLLQNANQIWNFFKSKSPAQKWKAVSVKITLYFTNQSVGLLPNVNIYEINVCVHDNNLPYEYTINTVFKQYFVYVYIYNLYLLKLIKKNLE